MADFIFKISPNIMLGSYLTARLGQFVKEWGTKYMLILDPDLQDFDIGDMISIEVPEIDLSLDAQVVGCYEVVKKLCYTCFVPV